MMLQEVGAKLDLKRVHFMGMLDYGAYFEILLQVSSVQRISDLIRSCCRGRSSRPWPAGACHRLRYPAGARGAARWQQRLDGDFFAHKQLSRRIERRWRNPSRCRRCAKQRVPLPSNYST